MRFISWLGLSCWYHSAGGGGSLRRSFVFLFQPWWRWWRNWQIASHMDGRLGPRYLTTIGRGRQRNCCSFCFKITHTKDSKGLSTPLVSSDRSCPLWLSVCGRGQGASWRPGQRGQFLDCIMFLSLLPTNSETESSLNTLLLSTVTYPVRAR